MLKQMCVQLIFFFRWLFIIIISVPLFHGGAMSVGSCEAQEELYLNDINEYFTNSLFYLEVSVNIYLFYIKIKYVLISLLGPLQ